MKKNILRELRKISEQVDAIAEEYSALVESGWTSSCEEEILYLFQVTGEKLKYQIEFLETYEKISSDDVIDFTRM